MNYCNKERIISFGYGISQFLEVYDELCPYHCDNFFVNSSGKPLTPNAVKLFMRKISKTLPYTFSSHKLRHNFATSFIINEIKDRGNTDVYSLKSVMGHESIETTERYLHQAQQILASRNMISHIDKVFGYSQKK